MCSSAWMRRHTWRGIHILILFLSTSETKMLTSGLAWLCRQVAEVFVLVLALWNMVVKIYHPVCLQDMDIMFLYDGKYEIWKRQGFLDHMVSLHAACMQPASTSSLLQLWCASHWCIVKLTYRLCRELPTCILLSCTFASRTCLSRSRPCSDAPHVCLATLPMLGTLMVGKLQLHWFKPQSAVSIKARNTVASQGLPCLNTTPAALHNFGNQQHRSPVKASTVGLQLY